MNYRVELGAQPLEEALPFFGLWVATGLRAGGIGRSASEHAAYCNGRDERQGEVAKRPNARHPGLARSMECAAQWRAGARGAVPPRALQGRYSSLGPSGLWRPGSELQDGCSR